ncbi:MAG: Alpha-L-fucosidase [Lentisphaerae bacterium ADurb.Bin242]|nr:MAG: Alpha-L-fucosidase [Lentisphaerae bacterium ADurb.Bin242]
MKWFHEARFGIYVHFGLYSILGRGEWTMYSERIPPEEYALLADRFLPEKGCAAEWAKAAVSAGAKYMVLTTRHHEGFCLYDSRYSDFTSVKRGPHRDLVREYVDAARKAGLCVGLYYSLLDWRFPGYFDPEKHPESREALVKQAHDQVRELMTEYGKIDLLEYDGGWDADLSEKRDGWARFWRAEELNAMVRRLQPGIIINDRSGTDEDIETPEQVVRAGETRATESCMCIGDSCAWGYTRFNPNWKSSEQLLQYLVQAAQGGGNYLLNIGPDPRGHVRAEELERLQALGRWLSVNGEAVYGAGRCALIGSSQPGTVDLNLQGPWTRKGNTGYWCIFRWPGKVATAIRIATPVKKVSLLSSGKEFPFHWNEKTGKLTISGLPSLPPDELCSVLKVEFESVPERMKESDLAAWLEE